MPSQLDFSQLEE